MWGLGGSFCFWATFLKAFQPGLQGLQQEKGRAWRGGDGGEVKGTQQGDEGKEQTVGPEAGAYNPRCGQGLIQSTLWSGLGREEQAGALTAMAVSVHKGQGVLCVVLDHGGHGRKQLDRTQGISESPEPHAGEGAC